VSGEILIGHDGVNESGRARPSLIVRRLTQGGVILKIGEFDGKCVEFPVPVRWSVQLRHLRIARAWQRRKAVHMESELPAHDGTDNAAVVNTLREIARLLGQQGANQFRIIAYHRAADTIDHLKSNIATLLARKGIDALIELPNIGRGLAATIEEIVRSGRSTQLDRLRGETDPEALLQTVPGIGPALAHAIHEELHIDTLEALEVAAHDGRLTSLPRLGTRRVAAIRASVASMLANRRPTVTHERPIASEQPPVSLLLDIDSQYRRSARAGELPTIAPRRFNPHHEAWLPVLHSQRNDWHFTALFSNTARAHQLGRTRDWVVIYFYDGEHRESQHTIVTETRGALTGQRVVRGREDECLASFAQEASRSS